jgi:RNA polymerase-binding transcription factor DksA
MAEAYVYVTGAEISEGGDRCANHGGAGMRKRELEFFRKILKQQLEELTRKSDASIAGLLNSTVTSADPLDRTSLELERDFTLRMLDRENKLEKDK